MAAGLSASLDPEMAIKTAFVSYYISMYNSIAENIGYDERTVTVDEIFDFIQDLKHEAGKQTPDITKSDIIHCFHLLHLSGVCRV